MSLSTEIIVYLYSYLPAFLFALFFWWMDRFDRESIWVVILAFLWGAYGAGSLSYFFNTFMHIAISLQARPGMGGGATSTITAVIVAPFVEELTKGLFILLLYRMAKIDNITDGILFGICVGLGFAAAENVSYAENTFKSYGAIFMWDNLWFREIHTTLLHAMASAVWGGMIAYSRYFTRFRKYFTIFNGFILAMVLHGFWNFMASFRGTMNPESNWVDLIMRAELICTMGALFCLFVFSVFNESRIIVRELYEEYKNGILPLEHIGFFASVVRHPKQHNLPKNTPVDLYAETGVKLAFRKHDYRHNPSAQIKKQIEHLRVELKKMSEHTPDSLTLHFGK